MLQNALSTFHPSTTADGDAYGGRSERKLVGLRPCSRNAVPPFSLTNMNETRMSTGITCHPLLNLFFPSNEGQSTRDVLARNSKRAAGFAEVDACWRATHFWQPQCICDPVALSCAVFDKRCCPARPDSVCCAASRAALWPISIGRFCFPSGRACLEATSARTSAKSPLSLLRRDRHRLESQRYRNRDMLAPFSCFSCH